MTETAEHCRLRPATEDDCALLLTLITALAEYEKLQHEVTATEALLRESLFGAAPAAESLIAEWQGQPAGFALFFVNYSTFLAKPGIYLEDLFVLPAYRGKGIGKVLLAALASIALQRGCGRFEWSVLDWNQPAIDFYRSVGAVGMADWTVQRLSGTALQSLAAQAPPVEAG